MSPNTAAKHANNIYAAWGKMSHEERTQKASLVLTALDLLAAHLSMTAFNKYLDFTYGVRSNYIA